MIDWRPIINADGKPDAYSIEGRVAGRHAYTVSRASVAGRYIYSAWPRCASASLGYYDSAEDARAACLAHLQTRGDRDATADR